MTTKQTVSLLRIHTEVRLRLMGFNIGQVRRMMRNFDMYIVDAVMTAGKWDVCEFLLAANEEDLILILTTNKDRTVDGLVRDDT